MKKFSPLVVASLLAVIAFSPKAQAQIFAPESVVLSESSVLNLGTTVLAFDVGNVTATVNGVDFSGATTGLGGVTFSYAGFENTDDNGVTSPPPVAYSSDLTNILQHLHFSASAATHSLTFANLTPGDIYSVQLFSGSYAEGYQVLADGSATGDLSYGGPGHTYSIIDTFTAGPGGSETIFSNSPTTYVLFNAVNLRDVTSIPEPQTYAILLGGLALLALIVVQRRRFSV